MSHLLSRNKHILIMLDMIPMIRKTDIVNAIEKDETKVGYFRCLIDHFR